MSKKSRKRNKKILAVLAAGLGAAALMKRRKAGEMSGNVTIPDSQKEGFKSNYITKKKEVLPAAVSTAGQDDSRFTTRFSKPHEEIISKADRVKNMQKNIAANYQRKQTFDAKPRFGALSVPKINVPGGVIKQYKKGGRVTGIAKRGFGRALMKGKR